VDSCQIIRALSRGKGDAHRCSAFPRRGSAGHRTLVYLGLNGQTRRGERRGVAGGRRDASCMGRRVETERATSPRLHIWPVLDVAFDCRRPTCPRSRSAGNGIKLYVPVSAQMDEMLRNPFRRCVVPLPLQVDDGEYPNSGGWTFLLKCIDWRR
jgi:hypothetical protein